MTLPTPFTIGHLAPAPREHVWDAWTQKEQLEQWFGPAGCSIVRSTLDLTVGGAYHYGIGLLDGGVMWGKWVFQTVDQPGHLAWHHAFSEEAGEAITRHPYSPTWPLEMTADLRFTAKGEQTEITLTMRAINTTEIERLTWEENLGSLNIGWGGTFAQLDTYLRR